MDQNVSPIGKNTTKAPLPVKSLQAQVYFQPIKRELFPNPPAPGCSPKATHANIVFILKYYGVEIQYDVVKKRFRYLIPGFSASMDNQDEAAYQFIVNLLIVNGMNTNHIKGSIVFVADKRLYNPIKDWILSKPWDGQDRLQAMCDTLVCKPDYPIELKELLVSKWLLSATAAALKPSGFKARGVLTLQGAQGLGKTAWGARLVPESMSQEFIRVDHHLDPSNKDSIMTAISHWIVEIGELESSFKKDVARLKGFLTSDIDKFRRPYAATDSLFQRRTVFFATVNQADFLIDKTGNSRWWTLPVESVNYLHEIDTQQLFAQLAIEFNQGAQWWLTSEEEQQLEEENKQYIAHSPIRDGIMAGIDLSRIGEPNLPAFTASDALRVLVGIERPNNPQARECGAILRELFGDPKKIQGSMKWRVPAKNDDFGSIGKYVTRDTPIDDEQDDMGDDIY